MTWATVVAVLKLVVCLAVFVGICAAEAREERLYVRSALIVAAMLMLERVWSVFQQIGVSP